MIPALTLIAALGLATPEAPATPPQAAVTVEDIDLLPRNCNSLVGDDGFYKVVVMHQSKNGRERAICVEWTDWDSFHTDHGDYCSGLDAIGCAAIPATAAPEPTAKPSCTDQIGEDGNPKVLIDHCKPVGRGGWKCKIQCVDQSAWDLDHSFHPNDSLI